MRKLLLLSFLIVLLFTVNIFVGAVHIPWRDVISVIFGVYSPDISSSVRYIIIESRVPCALTALLAGSSLAASGLLLQTAFHNPLAGPSVLGISGGASLGVAMVSLAGVAVPFGVLGAAFAGAVSITLLLLFLNTLLRNRLVLLITGLFVGYLLTAIITIMNMVATAEGLHRYVLWGMGDFGSVSLARMPVYALALLVLMTLCMMMIKPLNALLLGDSYAENLGLNIRMFRNFLLFVVGGITAVVTAYCGPVTFLGLAVPHMARMLLRTSDFRTLMPAVLLMGAVVGLLCNILCVSFGSFVLPLNAVTPLVGVPVIIWVVIKRH